MRALAICALGIVVAVAGCGHTPVVGPHRTLHLALTEYRIDPQSVRAPAGKLTILVRNYGRRTHNLVLLLKGQSQASTIPLWPGASAKLSLYLSPGTYVMESTILSDESLGVSGTLVVK
jgi:hypothetical protein